MQPLSLNVSFFEQTAQARPVRLRSDQGYAGPVSYLEVARIAAVYQAFVQAAAPSLQVSSRRTSIMSLETILIIVLVVFLFGGGGWYWGRGRG